MPFQSCALSTPLLTWTSTNSREAQSTSPLRQPRLSESTPQAQAGKTACLQSPPSASTASTSLYLENFSPVNQVLPSHLSRAVEILPRRLYWLAVNGSNQEDQSTCGAFHFNTDEAFVYSSFYADFGPLNLAMTHRYCCYLTQTLNDPQLSSLVIVHCTGPNEEKKANAAYLMAAFCVIILKWPPEKAAGLFSDIHPAIKPFRDASYHPCHYELSILDCCQGLYKAIQLDWYNCKTFDPEGFEYYEQLEHGDLQWIIPNKFLAFSTPLDQPKDSYCCRLSPEDYTVLFHQLGVTLVIRLNTKEYDEKYFTDHGIEHMDMRFMDGSCPPQHILRKFLEVTESHKGAIGVHCRAGLGRTGTLIGCYAIKNYDFPARAWIGWNRICRPGSVIGPQQVFLTEFEKQIRERRESGKAMKKYSAQALLGWLASLTFHERVLSRQGMVSQGHNVMKSFYKPKVKSTQNSNNQPEESPLSTTVNAAEDGDHDDASQSENLEMTPVESFRENALRSTSTPHKTAMAVSFRVPFDAITRKYTGK